jgi:hypothetical protein
MAIKKYKLTRWNIICMPKDQEGLGVEVLELRNKSLYGASGSLNY